MISRFIIEQDYSDLKDASIKCIKKGRFEDAAQLIKLASSIAYAYNFIASFSDIQLEENLECLAKKITAPVKITGRANKILFYDSFGYDNRGLTQQYLRALMALKYEIVYVLGEASPNFEKGDIYSELSSYAFCKTYKIYGRTNISKFKELVEIIINEQPSKIFMHLMPWDVSAYMSFISVENVVRYQINLTDHAFWLGVNITDVCLEFRSFGYSLSRLRGIHEDKLVLLPYYPIINEKPFQGLPDSLNGKKLICSGGSTYKILGNDLIFLNLIEQLLKIDKDLFFVYVGPGIKKPILDYFIANNLVSRVLVLENRKDINALLSKIDFFIDTFPLSGALMSQIAATVGAPIFCFSPQGYPVNDLGELFYKNNNILKFPTVQEFVEGFKAVYKDSNFLKSYSEDLRQSMINVSEFTKALSVIIEGKRPYNYLYREHVVKNHSIKFSTFLIESENKYNPAYFQLVINYLSPYKRRLYMKSFFRREQMINLRSNPIAFAKRLIRSYIK
jgi:hypothetical protein